MKGVSSGSLAICYSINKVPCDVNFISLKEVFLIMQKEKSILFFGGLYKGSLVNRLFEAKLSTFKSLKTTNINYISVIQNILTDIPVTISNSKIKLSFLLSKK
jgi:hypothetical protein